VEGVRRTTDYTGGLKIISDSNLRIQGPLPYGKAHNGIWTWGCTLCF